MKNEGEKNDFSDEKSEGKFKKLWILNFNL